MNIVRIIGLIIVGLVLVGLALVDFQAALIVAGGMGVALAAVLSFQRATSQRNRLFVIAGVVALIVIGLGAWVATGGLAGAGDAPPEPQTDVVTLPPRSEGEEPQEISVTVQQLSLFVTPTSDELTAFTVEPRITADIMIPNERVREGEILELETFEVPAQPLGFLVREVWVGDFDDPVTVTIDEQEVMLSVANVPALLILQDMPPGSFYDARDAVELSREPYVNLETITLELTNLERSVVFAIVRPPFAVLSGPLAPLLGAATASDWLMGVVAIVTGLALWPIFVALLHEWAEGKLIEVFRGERKK